MNNTIKNLLKDMNNHLYGGRILISFQLGSLNLMNNFRLHDYQFYDDNKTIELRCNDDNMILVSVDDISLIEATEEPEGIEYRIISNKGWDASISFI